MSGTPAFTRNDTRVDFKWGSTKPGGSNDPGFATLGATNYSIRWTGQFIPKYSETYTFTTSSDDGVRLFLKPTGTSTWTQLINNWTTHAATTNAGTYAVNAGSSYDMKLEYFQGYGGAEITLHWSSASTPDEVIDPVADIGNAVTDWTGAFTNIVNGARSSWGPPNTWPPSSVTPAMDQNGWPMGDGSYAFQESLNQGLGLDPLMTGTISFSFIGKADVSVSGNVRGLTYQYNATTNTTTGSFTGIDNGANASGFSFLNSHRDGTPTGPGGITNLKLMRPTAPGSTTSYSLTGAPLYTPQFLAAMGNYTLLRFPIIASQEINWSDRTTPGFFNQSGGRGVAPTVMSPWSNTLIGGVSHDGPSWEAKIQLANQTGRDMLISIPPLATGRSASDTSSYIYKLANLIRYGSDGVQPYTSPQSNPVYPGLNSNLRVYFEIGNELWNWASVFWTDYAHIHALAKAGADAYAQNLTSTPEYADFLALNYDNRPLTKDSNGAYVNLGVWASREVILRLHQISGTFKSVFGSGQMMTHVRPLYEWQNANLNDTARNPLNYADIYFNNGDGQPHVSSPQPVSSWLWGGGGATYYGGVNAYGVTTVIPDAGFESTTVAVGYNQAPRGGPWSFSGTAGIARVGGSNNGIPPAFDGSQMGYITDNGSMSVSFTVPTGGVSQVYGLVFRALNRQKSGAQSADTEKFRVFLDGTTDITAKTFSQPSGYQPPDYADMSSTWKARNVSWVNSVYYYTKNMTLTPGSTHTITFVGQGGGNTTNQTVFLESIQLTSADAIYAAGIPGGGEAQGQPIGSNYASTLQTEASWARAFGLNEFSYEGGWSLGGDDGGSPLQNVAKHSDSRTSAAQTRALDMFYQAGSSVTVLGTYAQWPTWSDAYAQQGLLNASSYPLVQAVDSYLNRLPAAATNGIAVPAVLNTTQVTLVSGYFGAGSIAGAGRWIDWNVIPQQAGQYQFDLTTTGIGSKAVLLVDDRPIATGSTGGVLSGRAFLTMGLHTVKVRSISNTSFSVTSVAVSLPQPSRMLISSPGSPSNGLGTATTATKLPTANGTNVTSVFDPGILKSVSPNSAVRILSRFGVLPSAANPHEQLGELGVGSMDSFGSVQGTSVSSGGKSSTRKARIATPFATANVSLSPTEGGSSSDSRTL